MPFDKLTSWAGKGRYVIETPWPAVPALAATVAILAGGIGAAALVSIALDGILGAQTGRIATAPVPGAPGSSPPGQGMAELTGRDLALMLVMQVLMAGMTLAATWRHGAHEALALLPVPGGMRTLARVFAGLLLVLALFNLLAMVIQPENWLNDLLQYGTVASSANWWLFALVIGIGAPLSEEFLFRGFLLPAIAKSRLGFAGGAVLSSAAWALLHWGYSVTSLLEVFAIGLYLSAVLWRTGSLWATIVCHGAYNLLLLVVLRFVAGGA